jgi:hypothetical protein
MKHIKLFLEGFDKSEYYWEVPELKNMTMDRFMEEWDVVDIDDKVWNNLLDMIDDNWDISEDEMGDKTSISISKKWGEGYRQGDDDYSICQLGDEYFIVICYQDNTYWKCDQFEGLVELLKDKGIIK